MGHEVRVPDELNYQSSPSSSPLQMTLFINLSVITVGSFLPGQLFNSMINLGTPICPTPLLQEAIANASVSNSHFFTACALFGGCGKCSVIILVGSDIMEQLLEE